MSELPKLREGSKWMNSCEIQDSSGDVVRILGVCVEIHQDGKYMLSAYTTDVLALLDANGKNTTANELRKELDESREKLMRVRHAMRDMQSVVGSLCLDASLAETERMSDMLRWISKGMSKAEKMIREALKGERDEDNQV